MTPPTDLRAGLVEILAKAIHERFIQQQPHPQDWPTWGELLAQGHQGQNRIEDTRALASADITALHTFAAERELMLVPIEPTRKMWAAGADAVVGYKQRHHDKVIEEVWTAMVRAAGWTIEPVGLVPGVGEGR